MIASGRVEVNGKICREFNADVDPDRDTLSLDGKPLSFKQFTYIALYKPKGVVTTMADEQGRTTVVDLLPKSLRHLKPVGRLDMYSEGLLILTNDGDFALKMTHPRHHVAKVYQVRARGSIGDRHLRQLERGVPLEDGMTLPSKVVVLERNRDFTDIEITIVEGRNRQLRRMFAYVGHPVSRLVRVAIGGLQLDKTAPGTWRYLTSQEVLGLLSQSTE